MKIHPEQGQLRRLFRLVRLNPLVKRKGEKKCWKQPRRLLRQTRRNSLETREESRSLLKRRKDRRRIRMPQSVPCAKESQRR